MFVNGQLLDNHAIERVHFLVANGTDLHVPSQFRHVCFGYLKNCVFRESVKKCAQRDKTCHRKKPPFRKYCCLPPT